MDCVHALAWYFPDSSGGTEVYVEGLVRELQTLGLVNQIAAASDDGQARTYGHAGVPVFRYPVAPAGTVEQVRGGVPHGGFREFSRWLEGRRASIYHQHSWTYACGLHHLEAAKSLGFKTVLTVHVPSNLCLRGTMMLFGERACDGRIEPARCAACWAQARGLPRLAAEACGRMPLGVSRRASRAGSGSRVATALAARALASEKREQFLRMVSAADRVVAVCGWLYDALRANDVPADKLLLSRQGVNLPAEAAERAEGQAPGGVFRLGFLGRWDETKGVHVLLDAIRRLPADLPLELRIFGLCATEQDRRYRDRLLAGIANDPRVRVEEPVARPAISGVLRQLDALAVPSQWQETGPLVVLEAQQFGVPVLGSDLGGIRELVVHGQDGWLIAPADSAAWADVIRKAVAGGLSLGGRAPRVRQMADAARDMAALYATLAGAATPADPRRRVPIG